MGWQGITINNPPFFHHEVDAAVVLGPLQWVSVENEHIGKLPTLEGTEIFIQLVGPGDIQLGMEPMAALMAATRNVARAYKVDKDLGTLERGKLADLLVLDRSPLEKAENYRSISLVMKEGQVIDRDALPAQKLLTAETRSHTATA